MSIKLDGREVVVGDRLWCFMQGWGTVIDIAYSFAFPILIRFDNYKPVSEGTYTSKGESLVKNRTLFWDEIKFEIPPPPKKKIKKWQWICLGKDGCYFLTGYHYATREEAEKSLLSSSVAGKLECSVIEVDEE